MSEIGFYVTVRRGSRTGFLLGPYDTHDTAKKNVDRAQREANEIDSWAWFYAFGTARVVAKPGRALPAGRLNERIGLELSPEEVAR